LRVGIALTTATSHWVAGLMVAGAMLHLAQFPAYAADEPLISQVIRTELPVYDQMGKMLLGNEPGREELGLEYIRGNRVEILLADIATTYPPLVDGSNDPRNPLLDVTYIGYGMDPSITHPGMFATSLTPRPPNGSKIFVRVFNMPSPELASFYSDSQLFTVSWSGDTLFNAVIPHTSNPIDPEDGDNDGLNNSWERWNGSDPGMVDTDGDGVDDKSELLAGTDADNWDSFLQIVAMTISNNIVSIDYMAGRDSVVHVQEGTNFTSFSQCNSVGGQTNEPASITTVEIPTDPSDPVTVFRLGVPVNEL
jgi:hypothetical protein